MLRFCRAIGLAGYPELRIALARAAQFEESDQQAGGPQTGDIAASDDLGEVVAKITHADSRAIEDTAAALDLDVLRESVDAVAKATRIDIYGAGASALVAEELHHKLHRIGLVSFAWSDPNLALSSAAQLTPADVAIGISHTGTTTDVLDAIKLARSRRATTIAITNFSRSPIAVVSDHALITAARETTFRSGAMSSRIAQLVVVDCLFAAVAQRSYDVSLEALQSVSAAVQTRHSVRAS